MAVDGVEFSGRTVEDAITQAESYFGETRSQLSIEIITQGRGGVFGIGAEPARVRARPPAPAIAEPPVEREEVPVAPPSAPEPAPTPAESTATAGETDGTVQPQKETRKAASAAAGDLPGDARDVLDQILQSMGFDAEVSVRSAENPVILSVTGQNLGVLIGRRGDNLASLQFMVNLILSKGRRQWPRVVIDVENYRARREESLRSLADRIAYRVGRNGRPFTLEAMPASDRRVIHLTLRERGDVETYSIGEGVARRVVIAPVRAGGGDGHREY